MIFVGMVKLRCPKFVGMVKLWCPNYKCKYGKEFGVQMIYASMVKRSVPKLYMNGYGVQMICDKYGTEVRCPNDICKYGEWLR